MPFISKLIKSYLLIHRFRKLRKKELKKLQDKAFRKIVKQAFTVPFYRKKYKKVGIHPDDIKKLEDIEKLPYITKDELRKNHLQEISPLNKNKLISISTSGTLGKPLHLFADIETILVGLAGYIRVMKEHGFGLRDKISIIVDLSENSAEKIFLQHLPFKKFLKNLQILNTYDSAEKIMNELNKFEPQLIGGYPGMLRHLAILKELGKGKNVNPDCIISTGSVIDKYLRAQIEDAFSTKVFDAYGATEAGPIAFECRYKRYHVHSDLVYMEYIDENIPSLIAITRLYGKGTPIIRYTGIDDLITPSSEIYCECGIVGQQIKEIHGRMKQTIILPNGKILLYSSILKLFGEISQKLNADPIERFQIIQHKIDELEIKVSCFDGKSCEKIFPIIENEFGKRFKINVKIKEEKIRGRQPEVISKIDINKISKRIFI